MGIHSLTVTAVLAQRSVGLAKQMLGGVYGGRVQEVIISILFLLFPFPIIPHLILPLISSAIAIRLLAGSLLCCIQHGFLRGLKILKPVHVRLPMR